MPNESKPIVLVADDEPSTVAMLSSHLRSKGFTVLEASDGDQAWELAHEHLPNLVLLDVMMPGMSGWEVCRKIREAVSLAHTGVIMLTGIGENLNEMTSPLYGADAYLDKPFEFSDLDQKISETIARRSAGALGRADGDSEHEDDAALVKKTLRAVTARKSTSAAEKPAEVKPKTAPKPERAPPKKPLAPKLETGPKPALAKAVARPAPKVEKPASVKAEPSPEIKRAPAKKATPAPVAQATPSKPSKAKTKAKTKMQAEAKASPAKPVKAAVKIGSKLPMAKKKPSPSAPVSGNSKKAAAKSVVRASKSARAKTKTKTKIKIKIKASPKKAPAKKPEAVPKSRSKKAAPAKSAKKSAKKR